MPVKSYCNFKSRGTGRLKRVKGVRDLESYMRKNIMKRIASAKICRQQTDMFRYSRKYGLGEAGRAR